MRHRILSAAILALCLALTAGPAMSAQTKAPATEIFAPWHFGLTYDEAQKLPGARKGEGAFAQSLFMPEVDYAGHKWDVRLDFIDAMLVRVSLMGAYGNDRSEAVNNALSDGGFEMLAILADGQRHDFIVIMRAEGARGLENKIASVHEKLPKRLSYAWFDTRNVGRDVKRKVRNLSEFTMLIAADTREVEVTLLGDGTTMQQMFVDFTLPVLETQTFSKPRSSLLPY